MRWWKNITIAEIVIMICMLIGSGYGAYSCEPIMGSDGLYKGYKLTY